LKYQSLISRCTVCKEVKINRALRVLPEAKKQNNPKDQPSFHCPERTQVSSHFINSRSILLCCYSGSTLYCQTWCCIPGVQDVAHISGVRFGLSDNEIRGVCQNLKPRESEKVSRGKICDEAFGDKGDTLTRQRAQPESRRPPFIGPSRTPI
jgi:hypothetical protein